MDETSELLNPALSAACPGNEDVFSEAERKKIDQVTELARAEGREADFAEVLIALNELAPD